MDGLNQNGLIKVRRYYTKEIKMKTLFKKSLISASMLLMSASAMATGSSSGLFQWAGSAPGTTSSNGICIVVAEGAHGAVPHGSGSIVFHNPSDNGSKHDIHSSTELAFTVVEKTNNECTKTETAFSYQVTNFKVGVNGSPLEDQTLNVDSNHSGVWMLKLAKNDQPAQVAPLSATNANAGDIVALTVAGDQLAVAAGESVVVQAFMLVNSTAV